MKFNDDDFLIKIEIPKGNQEDSKKIHKKIINKTTETCKKVLLDKLKGYLGEC